MINVSTDNLWQKRQSFGITIEALLFVYFHTNHQFTHQLCFLILLGEIFLMFDLSDCPVYT